MAQRDNKRNGRGESLTERRAAQTRAEIFDAAIELFVEQGYDSTSMNEVADAAGVSRRTLYRYFATKDDIVFEAPRDWLEVFDAAVADRREDEPTRDLFRRALLEVAAYLAEHTQSVLKAYSVVMSSQELIARRGRSDMEWVARYMELLAPDVAELEHGDVEAAIAAMALVGAQNALIVVWAQQPDADVVAAMRAMLDQVDSIWPQPCRTPPDPPDQNS